MHPSLLSNFVGGSYGMGGLETQLGAFIFLVLLVVIATWALAWKAFGLWHAAKNGQVKWFILMLLVNTVGIVEIIYLFFFRENRDTTPIFPLLEKTLAKHKERKHAKKGTHKKEEKTEESEEGHEG